jgi:hypothetical protein
MTLVSGCRVFGLQFVEADPSKLIRLTITGESGVVWVFDQPGWRSLSFGAGATGAYVWSAREVIVLPVVGAGTPRVEVVTDEDLLMAVRELDGWVLVCETSVRRVVNGIETSRVELSDVIASFVWVDERRVVIETVGGRAMEILLHGERVIVEGP